MFSFSQPTEAVISEFCSTVARWFILWTNWQARMVYALEKSDKRVLPHCWSLVHFVNKLTRADGVRAREGPVWICFFHDYRRRNARIRKNHTKRFVSPSLLQAAALYYCQVLYCIRRIKKRSKNLDSHVRSSAPTGVAAKGYPNRPEVCRLTP
jgi:hypothetical protein